MFCFIGDKKANDKQTSKQSSSDLKNPKIFNEVYLNKLSSNDKKTIKKHENLNFHGINSNNNNNNNENEINENLCKHCYQINQINKRKLSYNKDDNNNNLNSRRSSVSSSSSSVVTYANIEKIRKKTNHSQNNLNTINSKSHHSFVKENDYTEIDVNASKALFDASRAHQLTRVQQN